MADKEVGKVKTRLLKKLRKRFEYRWEERMIDGPNAGRYYNWVIYDKLKDRFIRGGMAFQEPEPYWLVQRMVEIYFTGHSRISLSSLEQDRKESREMARIRRQYFKDVKLFS